MVKTLQPIKDSSLAKQVFETIRGAIFAGEFQPGEALREAHLARDLQVSQVPVREALVQLEHLGLVVRVPNKGTTVTKLSEQDVQERLGLRKVMEEIAFIEAAQRMTDEDFTVLERHLEAISMAISKNAYFETAQADLEFHRFIWKQSGNNTLYATLDHLTVPLYAFIIILRRHGLENLKDTVAPHEELLTVLKTRDSALIKEVIRQHFDYTRAIPQSGL